jgi:photosystem II stability/assembly factor-like uncharacterized protein
MRLIISALCFLVILTGCRKDLLHFQAVEKLETHTSTDRFNKIYFLNDSVGFVVGGQRFNNSTILTTRDGGKTWSYQNIPDAPKALYGITASPSGRIYAIGFDGKLISSDNQGQDWLYRQLWYLPYRDVAFATDTRGIAVGGVSFNAGVRNTIDSAGNMTPWDSTGYEMNDIEMVDGRTGYISGSGVVLKTTDSGHTWQLQNIKNDHFTAIHAYGLYEAWTCGANGSIFHTIDGGEHWEQMRNGNDITRPHCRLQDIGFTDPLNGYAVGEDGLLIYTDDGGHHWMEYDRFTTSHLRCIVAHTNRTLFVCGDDGTLFSVQPSHFP